MNEAPKFLTICTEHHTLIKSDWLGANSVADDHVQIFGCHEPLFVVHEKPWNVPTNDAEEIAKLGEEARIIYQYGS